MLKIIYGYTFYIKEYIKTLFPAFCIRLQGNGRRCLNFSNSDSAFKSPSYGERNWICFKRSQTFLRIISAFFARRIQFVKLRGKMKRVKFLSSMILVSCDYLFHSISSDCIARVAHYKHIIPIFLF